MSDLSAYALLAIAVLMVVHGAVRAAVAVEKANRASAAALAAGLRSEKRAHNALSQVEEALARIDQRTERLQTIDDDVQALCERAGVDRKVKRF